MPAELSTEAPNPEVFNRQVWEYVLQVPRGRVTTYGKVAQAVGAPEGVSEETYKAFGPRWVGTAMAQCPAEVPWQRVINSAGQISVRRGGMHLQQRALLEAEGVVFDQNEKIDLRVYLWDPGTPRQSTLW